MTNQVITIGRDEASDLVLTDKSISRSHLTIALKDARSAEFVLKDNNSSYGTFVDGLKTLETTTNILTSEIKLASYVLTDSDKEKSMIALFHKNNIYANEFKVALAEVTKYDQDKAKITNPRSTLLRRGAFSLGVMGIIALIPALNTTLKSMLMIVVGPTVFAMLDKSQIKKQEELENLKLQHEENMKCPKCSLTLLTHSANYWKAKKKCPNTKCNAIWQL